MGSSGGSDSKESACKEGSLGQEDLLKMGMASSILSWRKPWASGEEPGGLQSMGSQRFRHN